MAGMDDVLSRLTDNPSFLDWLSGKASGRGVPSWDPTTAGRSGGFPGREPGMPRAPGNSPSQMQTRFGGTYAPSGNMPVPPSGNVPVVGGSGVGGPPASLSGALGGSGGVNFNRFPSTGIWNLIAPAAWLAQQRDIGSSRHTQQEMIDWLMKRNASPQSSNGGSMMPIPIPPASAAPIQAQPIPNSTGNTPAQLVKDQSRLPAQPSWAGMAQMPNNLPPTPQPVPLPVDRPQTTQQVPLPTPRPPIAQRVPMPA